MSQSKSITLNGPPYRGTRSQNSESTMNADQNVMAEINAMNQQIRTMQANDKLPNFQSATSDPHVWIGRFETLAGSRHWHNKHEMLPTYLDDDEHEWYRELPEATQTNYTFLKTAFLEEFGPSDTDRFDAETALRARKQTPAESVKSFVRIVQREARRIGMDEQRGVTIILKNMLPAARVTITTTPATYRDLLDTPVAKGAISITSTTTTSKYDELVALLMQKEAQIAALQQEQPHQQIQPHHQQRQRRQINNNTDTQQSQQRRPPPPQQRTWIPEQHYQQRPIRPCAGCGGKWHDRSAQCPAWGKVCHNCGKENHYTRCCRRDSGASLRA